METEKKLIQDEIIKSLSIPSPDGKKVSEAEQKNLQKNLSAPATNKTQEKIPVNDILKNLSAPAK